MGTIPAGKKRNRVKRDGRCDPRRRRLCEDAIIEDRQGGCDEKAPILMTPHAPLEIVKNSFSYRGLLTWNALPESISKCATLNSFKKALRAHVFI